MGRKNPKCTAGYLSEYGEADLLLARGLGGVGPAFPSGRNSTYDTSRTASRNCLIRIRNIFASAVLASLEAKTGVLLTPTACCSTKAIPICARVFRESP
jgi:hypothetical protein